MIFKVMRYRDALSALLLRCMRSWLAEYVVLNSSSSLHTNGYLLFFISPAQFNTKKLKVMKSHIDVRDSDASYGFRGACAALNWHMSHPIPRILLLVYSSSAKYLYELLSPSQTQLCCVCSMPSSSGSLRLPLMSSMSDGNES